MVVFTAASELLFSILIIFFLLFGSVVDYAALTHSFRAQVNIGTHQITGTTNYRIGPHRTASDHIGRHRTASDRIGPLGTQKMRVNWGSRQA